MRRSIEISLTALVLIVTGACGQSDDEAAHAPGSEGVATETPVRPENDIREPDAQLATSNESGLINAIERWGGIYRTSETAPDKLSVLLLNRSRVVDSEL